ncbi:MAG: protein kinase [Solirubrobacterales bacterium]
MIERGSSFGGYTVERLLGSGGMGVVYEAVQNSLDRRVALKILKPELAGDPAFVDRFRREGRLQATIEHPHVLDVYEVGESEDHDLFLAMRLVDGPTLADLLRAGELDAARTVDLLGQVGEALDAANAAGLVHRDVKPQNVLVGDGDQAFLADFGLSRIGTDPDSRSRPTFGTVAYAAPEVIAGESPGPASDRYAFAATLFHCLTGDVVFPRGSEAAVLFAHASEPPPRISARRPELPAALDQVFEEALAKDPGRRPASARGLVAAVRERLAAAGMAELGPPRLGSPSPLSSETLAPVPTTTPADAAEDPSGGEPEPGRVVSPGSSRSSRSSQHSSGPGSRRSSTMAAEGRRRRLRSRCRPSRATRSRSAARSGHRIARSDAVVGRLSPTRSLAPSRRPSSAPPSSWRPPTGSSPAGRCGAPAVRLPST